MICLYLQKRLLSRRPLHALWKDQAPIREELFSIERLEEHAISLAKIQQIADFDSWVLPLHKRLNDNAKALSAAYQETVDELEVGGNVVPAAIWLIDNFHVIEQQVCEVRDDLPRNYYQLLPKLANGPFKGYPRVFGLSWAYVAHTDSYFDPDSLLRFVQAYQTEHPLRISELWAVAITLRIILLENLRRLAEQISFDLKERKNAEQFAERLLVKGQAYFALQEDIAKRSSDPLSAVFAAHLAKSLRDQDPKTTPALEWLEQRLQRQDLTVEGVVYREQQRLGVSNVSIRNVITSMRMISDTDWTLLFEKVCLVDRQLHRYPLFAQMDLPTRNLYRSAVEQLARGCSLNEIEIAQHAVEMARLIPSEPAMPDLEVHRLSDPGYYLIDQGREALEHAIGYKPTRLIRLRRLHIRLGVSGYFGVIALMALLFLLLLYAGYTPASPSLSLWMLWAMMAFIPATEVAITLVNRIVNWSSGTVVLPGLSLQSGVPASLRTLIVIPTLLTSETDILEQIERLEVHYLSAIGGDVSFALLTDGLDATQENLASDRVILSRAKQAIARLNAHYQKDADAPRFILLHRRRQFNPSENVWMGWERKRGKLHELNRLLRGATDTSYEALEGELLEVPSAVQYVITLDSDTQLPRETALRLIGKMAHPLNRPRLDVCKQRVVAGYGILQPRVTPALTLDAQRTLFQQIYTTPAGIDPYAAAISDVYQDLFGEGSFTGKGIYDVDIFEAVLKNRVPNNTLLSHDLFEGNFARAGLASDIEVVEDFPTRYDTEVKRQHRWMRGDWQLLPWILAKKTPKSVSVLGRLKMLDNLRRSLVAPMIFVSLISSWLLFPASMLFFSVTILFVIALPPLLPCVFSFFPRRKDFNALQHVRTWLGDMRLALSQVGLDIVFLPDKTWRAMDAISRTLVRLSVTHQHYLEWVTAAQHNASPRLSLFGCYQHMLGGVFLGVGSCVLVAVIHPANGVQLIPLALLWLLAPGFALWISQPLRERKLEVNDASAITLRLMARKTWRYFETFVHADENGLPPDNFQEEPFAVIAHRTSPTNIGLYLLSTAAARDFGWAGWLDTLERLERTFVTLAKLSKYKGHLFNWYDTQTLDVLLPEYVSSVDSGNLAGHLIALANSCEEWKGQVARDQAAALGLSPCKTYTSTPEALLQQLNSYDKLALRALSDTVELARQCLHDQTAAKTASQGVNAESSSVSILLNNLSDRSKSQEHLNILAPILISLITRLISIAEHNLASLTTKKSHDDDTLHRAVDLIFWLKAAESVLLARQRDTRVLLNAPDQLLTRFDLLAQQARQIAYAMEFDFLLNQERRLFSVGYSVTENSLDDSCYDLLASEARLSSYFAIAKGDVETKHWFRLGRSATPLKQGLALISWSGSMFEYLMPSLVMHAPKGSLLEQTNRLIVTHQQEYGRHLGIPWGMSESAYNARDIEYTYQYMNFGVPGLGFKRGLAENKVIAPYATGLASMLDPQAAVLNYAIMQTLGASGRYGFYEAIDFTPTRLPAESVVDLVQSYMAHHQGMTIVAVANTLMKGLFRRRFHHEPMVKSCELLLQERVPRNVCFSHTQPEKLKANVTANMIALPTVRYLNAIAEGTPVTHLLSNGRYVVMLTAAGAGYSRWKDIAVSRWQEDTTSDQLGSYIFMQDKNTGQLWSCTAQPLLNATEYALGSFEEDHAKFMHQESDFTTTMDVLVSGEDDGEVRRIALFNHSNHDREIELTSYMELVLTTMQADNAHPAFAKMFVQTEFMPEYQALIATRRQRHQHETCVWVAHFAIIEGETLGEPQYETNRALFIGRGHSIATAAAFQRDRHNTLLSMSLGTVLDPLFSLRYTVRVPAKGMVRVAFWTLVASSRSQLIDLIDRHHDRSAFERAKTLDWTLAQVQLHHLGITSAEIDDFQRLAAPIIYADPRFRVSTENFNRGIASQSLLWPHAISGDFPIVILRIEDNEDLQQLKQLLRAHEFWRIKRLAVDLVVINEHACSYFQELQTAIETAIRSSQSRPQLVDKLKGDHVKGSVFLLRADGVDNAVLDLLKAIARVVLVARRGSLNKQIAQLSLALCGPDTGTDKESLPGLTPEPHPVSPPDKPVIDASSLDFSRHLISLKEALELFNGVGGFNQDGKEYVVILDQGASTPAPWINVITNPYFGFHVAAEGGGFTWAENSRENRLTPWCNDPVSNPSGEAIYVRDEETLQLYSPCVQPLYNSKTNPGAFIAYHGFGYSRFEHQVDGIFMSLIQYVPLQDAVKISRLTLHNRSQRRRYLSVTAYIEWVLGTSRGESAPVITTELDEESNALLVSNPWNVAFSGKAAFADMLGKQSSWTTDRREFLGQHGQMSAPAALCRKSSLSGASGRSGAGQDPCTAQQCRVTLESDESVEIVMLLGQGESEQQAHAWIAHYRQADLDQVLDDVKHYWSELLGSIQVKTPDRSMDIMLNGWLLYQTVACRLWARSAFYQASGAYGFRDQLQDGMALTSLRPALTRAHILRAASRQFLQGDFQHWWLPHSGQGVRTHISDDNVWLSFATVTYIQTSGDATILDEIVHFIEGPALTSEQHDAYFQPIEAEEKASVYEHCARGLDLCVTLTGEHGLPLMGTGDWNDGMNRVGEAGYGESVWLGWLLIRTLNAFIPLAQSRQEQSRVQRWQAQIERVQLAIESEAWDGDWYRRACFDNGRWLGSIENSECQIDSIVQSWAVLSEASEPARAVKAMVAVEQYLIKPEQKLALLFTPPFDKTPDDPGYIKAYPPGLRENGGQYSHAAMWAILAYTQLQQGQKAYDLFALLNPINHARTLEDVHRYKVEPYVVAADIYSVAPHEGRGGWTWYTGAAGWMYQAGIQGILGLQRRGNELWIQPCIPPDWPGYEAKVSMKNTQYVIVVSQSIGALKGLIEVELDGLSIQLIEHSICIPLDGGQHELVIKI